MWYLGPGRGWAHSVSEDSIECPLQPLPLSRLIMHQDAPAGGGGAAEGRAAARGIVELCVCVCASTLGEGGGDGSRGPRCQEEPNRPKTLKVPLLESVPSRNIFDPSPSRPPNRRWGVQPTPWGDDSSTARRVLCGFHGCATIPLHWCAVRLPSVFKGGLNTAKKKKRRLFLTNPLAPGVMRSRAALERPPPRLVAHHTFLMPCCMQTTLRKA